jgi:hypothetical protein
MEKYLSNFSNMYSFISINKLLTKKSSYSLLLQIIFYRIK